MILQTQKTKIIFAVPALLLSAAFFGNLFVEGWNWDAFDFIIAAILLFGTALFINGVIRSEKSFLTKVIISLIILLILSLIWIELAVGIFGSPFAGS